MTNDRVKRPEAPMEYSIELLAELCGKNADIEMVLTNELNPIRVRGGQKSGKIRRLLR
jgi:hypothetical protein